MPVTTRRYKRRLNNNNKRKYLEELSRSHATAKWLVKKVEIEFPGDTKPERPPGENGTAPRLFPCTADATFFYAFLQSTEHDGYNIRGISIICTVFCIFAMRNHFRIDALLILLSSLTSQIPRDWLISKLCVVLSFCQFC